MNQAFRVCVLSTCYGILPINIQTPALSLASLLLRHQSEFGPVLPVDLNGPNVTRLDFTNQNRRVAQADLRNTADFDALVNDLLAEQNAVIGIGGYLENRVIYRRSLHFGSSLAVTPRSLHLGVDVWMPASTIVQAPLPATVHSLFDNDNFGDYGPTVILQHELEDVTFYSLYGHLSRHEWRSLSAGQALQQGEAFATIGPYPENGDWPPHLHFQLIADMQGRRGDFPGVARPEEREKWAELCPDPNIVLQCKRLV